jgi:hypothetical protein
VNTALIFFIGMFAGSFLLIIILIYFAFKGGYAKLGGGNK